MNTDELKKQIILKYGSVKAFADKINKQYTNVSSVLNNKQRNTVIEALITADFDLEEDFFDFSKTVKKIKKIEFQIKSLDDLKNKIIYDFGSLAKFCRNNNIDNAELTRVLQKKSKNNNYIKILKKQYNLPKDFFDKE